VETPARRRRRVVKRRVDIPRTLPILPVRDNVYFPNTLAPVLVGREKSLRAVEAALEMHNKLMLLVTQRDVTIEEPTLEDLFEVGVVAEILQAIHAPDNTMRVVFRGVQRARLVALQFDEPYLLAQIDPIPTREAKLTTDIEALMRSAVEMFEEIASHERSIPPEVVATISYMQEPGRLADTIAHFAPLRFTDKQKVLETVPVKERLETLVHLLRHELEVVELQQRIRDRVEQELGDTQREYYLREQLKSSSANWANATTASRKWKSTASASLNRGCPKTSPSAPSKRWTASKRCPSARPKRRSSAPTSM
jgi:ATP-dependent Lon protease, bacterial type